MTGFTTGDYCKNNTVLKSCISRIHNKVSDAISCLDYGPLLDNRNWMTFKKFWCFHTIPSEVNASTSTHKDPLNLVFVNSSEENAIGNHKIQTKDKILNKFMSTTNLN